MLSELLLCHNHQVNLVLVEAVNNAPKSAGLLGKLISNLYCASSLWLRMGTHFLRVVGSLDGLLRSEQYFTWIQNPSANDLERGAVYRKELAAYLLEPRQTLSPKPYSLVCLKR